MADDITPNLALPYIMPAQAQKHVTHNEAIRFLDALVQLSVETAALAAPPENPADGARYIVAADGTDAWLGHDGEVAAFQDGAWAFYVPRVGWIAWVADDSRLVAWNGETWVTAGGSTNPVDLVGINATADTANRLTVASPATLFNHDGAGHQLKINKADADDTASLLYQTGFSGRAEMGTAGDDDFHVKVSSDGSTWHEAIVVDRTTGAVSLPNTVTTASVLEKELAHGDHVIELASDSVAPGGPTFALTYSHHPIDDGGPESPDYSNHVMHMGWNVEAGGGRVDADQPSWSIAFESQWRQNASSPFGVEWHLRMQDTGGEERRPISVFANHDGSGGGITLAGDYIDITDLDGAPGYRLDIAAGEVDFTRGYLRGQTAWFSGTSANNNNALLQVDGEVGENHSGVVIALNGDSDANAIAMNFQTDQPGPLTTVYQNNDTSANTAAHVRVIHRVLANGGGDAFATYEKLGTAPWSAGYSNGGNAYRIANGADLGGNVKVEVRPDRIALKDHVRVSRISGLHHNWGTVWFGGSDDSGSDSTVAVGGASGPHYGIAVRADADIGWAASAGEAKGARDLLLWRDAAGRLALRNGSNDQAFRIYGSYTDAANYERASLACADETVILAAETAGSGADDMDIALSPAGDGHVRFGSHAAVSSETITGYITIKDSSGTLRKLAVLS
jgi:hypothetical protein